MPKRVIFLDRDGVINKEVKYLFRINDFIFHEGIFSTCTHFLNLGYEIIIVTNQSGIARGYYNENDFKILSVWMINCFKEKNINILDIFHCPHNEKSNCKCRKPRPGMLLDAKEKYNIDMQNSWLIGDKESDIIAAKNSGIENTVLVRSGHKIDELNSKAKFFMGSIQDVRNLIMT